MNTTALTDPNVTYSINPEFLEVVQTYLTTLSVDDTAEALAISKEDVIDCLKNKEVKTFINTVFLEQGYMNRFKLAGLLNTIIESKLEEAEESGIYTNKDLLEILTLVHKIQMDYAKMEQVSVKQTNVQVNNYNNLGSLIDRIVSGV